MGRAARFNEVTTIGRWGKRIPHTTRAGRHGEITVPVYSLQPRGKYHGELLREIRRNGGDGQSRERARRLARMQKGAGL